MRLRAPTKTETEMQSRGPRRNRQQKEEQKSESLPVSIVDCLASVLGPFAAQALMMLVDCAHLMGLFYSSRARLYVCSSKSFQAQSSPPNWHLLPRLLPIGCHLVARGRNQPFL